MSASSIALLSKKLNRRANSFTTINSKSSLVTRWHFHDLKRYDFDCFLLDSDWQAVSTIQDAWNFGLWSNASDYCILSYDQGECVLVTCHSYDAFKAELRDVKASLLEQERAEADGNSYVLK